MTIAAAQRHYLAEQAGANHLADGQDVAAEEHIFQRKHLPRKTHKRLILTELAASANLQRNVASGLQAVQSLRDVAVPRRADEHQLGALFGQHPAVVVGAVGIDSQTGERIGGGGAPQPWIRHGRNLEKRQAPEQAQKGFSAVAGAYQNCFHRLE